jgi:hypothetical protein
MIVLVLEGRSVLLLTIRTCMSVLLQAEILDRLQPDHPIVLRASPVKTSSLSEVNRWSLPVAVHLLYVRLDNGTVMIRLGSTCCRMLRSSKGPHVDISLFKPRQRNDADWFLDSKLKP